MAIAFVQAFGNTGSSQQSLDIDGLNPTAGNSIIVCTSNYNDGQEVTGVVDSASNIYVRAGSVQGGNASHAAEVWIAHDVNAHSSMTITVTFESPTNFITIMAAEYSGLHLTDAFDAESAGGIIAAAQPMSSLIAATTDTADELILGMWIAWTGDDDLFAEAPYTLQFSLGYGEGAIVEQIVSSTGDYHSEVECDTNYDYWATVRTFRAAGGEPPDGLVIPVAMHHYTKNIGSR